MWRREFPGKPAVLRTVDPQVAGVLNAAGNFEAFDVRTGKTVAAGQVDAAQVERAVVGPNGSIVATEPLLLLDAERTYLVLSRGRDLNNPNRMNMGYNGQSMLRSPRAHAVFDFHREAGDGERHEVEPRIVRYGS